MVYVGADVVGDRGGSAQEHRRSRSSALSEAPCRGRHEQIPLPQADSPSVFEQPPRPVQPTAAGGQLVQKSRLNRASGATSPRRSDPLIL